MTTLSSWLGGGSLKLGRITMVSGEMLHPEIGDRHGGLSSPLRYVMLLDIRATRGPECLEPLRGAPAVYLPSRCY